MNMSTRRNERWSAMDSTTTNRKNSDRLRSLLYEQDIQRNKPSFGSGLDLSFRTMGLPSIRRGSLSSIGDSLGSMSSLSTAGSYTSRNIIRSYSRQSPKRKSQLHYQNRESKNSLLSLNTRWKSSPTQRRLSTTSMNISKLLQVVSISPTSPRTSINHQGRWKAMSVSDSAIDRPISVIRRKASFNAISPPSA